MRQKSKQERILPGAFSHRVKAFTIIEMTVVMLLSAIVISMAYFAFELLSRRYVKYKEQSEVFYKVTLLDQLLSRDFFVSDSIKSEGEILKVYKADITSDYHFGSKYVVRQFSGQTDTFYFNVEKKELLYNQQLIADGNSMTDQLNLTLLLNGKVLEYNYIKHYSAAIRINKALNETR